MKPHVHCTVHILALVMIWMLLVYYFLDKHKDSFILCPCAVSRTFLVIHYLEQYPKSENKHSVTISKQFYCL